MSTKKKKRWLVLDMDGGTWYWVEDQPTSKDAIEEYLTELCSVENDYELKLQVYPVTKYEEFDVTKKVVTKTEKEIKLVEKG